MSIASPEESRAVARAKHAADGVYGTILALAVIAAFSKDPTVRPEEMLGGLLATSFVFWVVHVYAAVLGRRARGDTAQLWPLTRIAARDEWPLVEAALAPAVPLLLWWVGILHRQGAVTLSLIVGLADLASWGYIAGRVFHQSRFKAALSGMFAVALGTLMVLLKNLVH